MPCVNIFLNSARHTPDFIAY